MRFPRIITNLRFRKCKGRFEANEKLVLPRVMMIMTMAMPLHFWMLIKSFFGQQGQQQYMMKNIREKKDSPKIISPITFGTSAPFK